VKTRILLWQDIAKTNRWSILRKKQKVTPEKGASR